MIPRFSIRRAAGPALFLATAVLLGCGGGGRIHNNGNTFVAQNNNTTFPRQIAMTPDGTTLLWVKEASLFNDTDNSSRSVLSLLNTNLGSVADIRVPTGAWAVHVVDNNTAYIAADSGRVAKINLGTRSVVNIATGLSGLRDILVTPDGKTLFACNDGGRLFIYDDVDLVTEADGFGARTTLEVNNANFVSLRYEPQTNRVVVADAGDGEGGTSDVADLPHGRIFLVDGATKAFVNKASPSSKVELLPRANEEAPFIYQVQETLTSKPFKAFEPVLAVNGIRIGSQNLTAAQTTFQLDPDGAGAGAALEYTWAFNATTGQLKIYRGGAATTGNEITSPMVEDNETITASDIRLDLNLAERFYLGQGKAAVAAEIIRSQGADWLFVTVEELKTNTTIDNLDNPNDPTSGSRDNQLQVYKITNLGTLPLAVTTNCNVVNRCVRVGQVPVSMKIVTDAAVDKALAAVANFGVDANDDFISYLRINFASGEGELEGPDFDANGVDPVFTSSGADGPWDMVFSPDRSTLFVSHHRSQTVTAQAVPATLRQGF